MKKVFLICPVRGASEEQKQFLEKYIKDFNGDVYYPARDTNQSDLIGYQICTDNMSAIKSADEVHIFYDPQSAGTLFDMGMAFAMGKKVVIVNRDDLSPTEGKSFLNMLLKWEDIKG
jgi:nucleoside 2-deoxyribosyltransferase